MLASIASLMTVMVQEEHHVEQADDCGREVPYLSTLEATMDRQPLLCFTMPAGLSQSRRAYWFGRPLHGGRCVTVRGGVGVHGLRLSSVTKACRGFLDLGRARGS